MNKKTTLYLMIGYLVLGAFFLLRKQPPPPPPVTAAAAAEWPYKESRTLAVVTTKNVLNGGKPILFVFHDTKESGWQFLDASTPSISELTTATLEEMVKRDASLHSVISDLKPGWGAFRKQASDKWTSAPNP